MNTRVLLLLLVAVSAVYSAAATVSIIGPPDGASVSGATEFMFNVDRKETTDRCELVLDDEVVKTYQLVPAYITIRFTYTAPAGEHTWSVRCADDDGGFDESSAPHTLTATKAVTFEQSPGIKVVNGRIGNGLMYIVDADLDSSHKYTLTTLRPNDIIEIDYAPTDGLIRDDFGVRINFIEVFIIRTSSASGADFLDIRVGKIDGSVRLFEGDSTMLDVDRDGIEDTEFQFVAKDLKNIVVALTTLPHDANVPTEDEAPQEPVVDDTEPMQDEQDAYVPATDDDSIIFPSDATDEDEDVAPGPDVKDETSMTGVWWVMIILCLVLVAALFISQRPKKPQVAEKPVMNTSPPRKEHARPTRSRRKR
ncbi:MAG: hypothetical protein ABIH41_03425 [Nanoarchaeota archaeon]